MNDKELNDMVMPLFDFGGPIKALSDASWKRRTNALSDACVKTKSAIVALIQRTEQAQEQEIVRLRDALRDFGDHNPLCKRLRPYTCAEMRPACDCGWNEILEPSVVDRCPVCSEWVVNQVKTCPACGGTGKPSVGDSEGT